MKKNMIYLIILISILFFYSCAEVINKYPDNVKKLTDMLGINSQIPEDSNSHMNVSAYSTNSFFYIFYNELTSELTITRDNVFYTDYIYIYLSEYSYTGSIYYPWVAKASSDDFYGSKSALWDISRYLTDGTLKKGYTYYIYVYPSYSSNSYLYPPLDSTKVGYIEIN